MENEKITHAGIPRVLNTLWRKLLKELGITQTELRVLIRRFASSKEDPLRRLFAIGNTTREMNAVTTARLLEKALEVVRTKKAKLTLTVDTEDGRRAEVSEIFLMGLSDVCDGELNSIENRQATIAPASDHLRDMNATEQHEKLRQLIAQVKDNTDNADL